MKKKFTKISVSAILFLRNSFRLIFSPYKTMRSISSDQDILQSGIIFFLCYLYFIAANIIRKKTLHPFIISSSSVITFLFFLVTFFLVTLFFYVSGRRLNKSIKYFSILSTFSYSLIPTLLWFFITSLFYLTIPPPRNLTFPGKLFSLFFIFYSATLFIWKIILFYLSLRFSLKINFYKIFFLIALFLMWFLPYSYLMYKFGIFRIPFI